MFGCWALHWMLLHTQKNCIGNIQNKITSKLFCLPFCSPLSSLSSLFLPFLPFPPFPPGLSILRLALVRLLVSRKAKTAISIQPCRQFLPFLLLLFAGQPTLMMVPLSMTGSWGVRFARLLNWQRFKTQQDGFAHKNGRDMGNSGKWAPAGCCCFIVFQ